MPDPTRSLEPIIRTVRVPVPPERAFRRFTAELARWWPLETHAVEPDHLVDATFGAGAGERIVERGRDGGEHAWGTVREWDPPRRVVFTWHPGRDPSTAQEVEATFEADGDGTGTLLTLVHGDWDRYGPGAEAAWREYGPGWEMTLGRYHDSLAAG